MNKEEILAKSRKDVMNKFAPLGEIGKSAIGLMTQVTCLSHFAYQLVNNKTRTSIFFTIAFALTTDFYLYLFPSEMNGLPF